MINLSDIWQYVKLAFKLYGVNKKPSGGVISTKDRLLDLGTDVILARIPHVEYKGVSIEDLAENFKKANLPTVTIKEFSENLKIPHTSVSLSDAAEAYAKLAAAKRTTNEILEVVEEVPLIGARLRDARGRFTKAS